MGWKDEQRLLSASMALPEQKLGFSLPFQQLDKGHGAVQG